MSDGNESKANKPPTSGDSVDKELDDLLDSALQDFGSQKNAKTGASGTGGATENSQQHDDPPTEQLWNNEFISAQAQSFEDKLAAMFGGGNAVTAEQMALGFQRIAEAATMARDREAPNMADAMDPSVSQSINDALRGLSEGRDNLQAPFSPDDIASMFGNIDLNESGENNPFLPFMQNMLQTLLSADVLLPSLKDLVEKYPKWLEENGSKIPKEDKERYEKQLASMREVCDELEKEQTDDTAEVKRQRFQSVLDKMHQMQNLGQPPAGLVADLGIDNLQMPAFDPSVLGDPNQCAPS